MMTEPMAEPVPASSGTNPDDAPYGRKADGSPRGKPGPKRGPSTGPAGPTRPAAAAPPRRPGGPARPGSKSKIPDFRPGINGLLQIAGFPLALGGKANPALALDAAALAMHGPNVAEALQAIAEERPEVAAALERILSVGPYGLLIGAVIPLAAQVLLNHKKLPEAVGVSMGAVPRDVLAGQLRAQAAAMNPEQGPDGNG